MTKVLDLPYQGLTPGRLDGVWLPAGHRMIAAGPRDTLLEPLDSP
jgi:hypothetical protein